MLTALRDQASLAGLQSSPLLFYGQTGGYSFDDGEGRKDTRSSKWKGGNRGATCWRWRLDCHYRRLVVRVRG